MIANDNSKPAKPTAATAGVEAWSGKDRGDENFPVGSLLIAKALRPHIHAYYTFARNADDIADNPALAPEEKLARLDAMEAVLTGARAEGSPSAARLRASLAETGVNDIHARELLIAFRQDATKTRYASWDELLQYCRYSAAPVGRYVLALHGESEATWPPSDALCAALQVLNHMQDCAKDLRDLDRCYIPQDWLAEAGLATDALARGETVPDLRAVFDRMLDATERLNRDAAALPRAVRAPRLRVETAVIAGLARRLTTKLRAGDPLATRVKLSKLDFLTATLAGLRYAA
ncbi:squalene synthase HpnC [Acidocella sp. KAb 2-4]|uniref:squalene synthase HpnC n=1 Tax=Acidocella sp. KAb 2-4 TaxID=2885158 RepID=UPI001D08E840|nr:squalene synthase HpnC [Acidocella sp. KAb 2-4]MCB5945450.1 squalene synthase HpnC [Acidocella sp. KAb 2-4]